MAIYEEMQDLANELLSDPDFAQPTINYVQVVNSGGTIDEPAPTTYVVTPLNAVARGVATKYVAAGLAVASDLQITSAVHPNITPDQRDFIEVDGKRLKIMQILPRPAAATRVVWTFIVQSGEKTNRTVS